MFFLTAFLSLIDLDCYPPIKQMSLLIGMLLQRQAMVPMSLLLFTMAAYTPASTAVRRGQRHRRPKLHGHRLHLQPMAPSLLLCLKMA